MLIIKECGLDLEGGVKESPQGNSSQPRSESVGLARRWMGENIPDRGQHVQRPSGKKEHCLLMELTTANLAGEQRGRQRMG